MKMKISAIFLVILLLGFLSIGRAETPLDCSRLLGSSQLGELFNIDINTGNVSIIGYMPEAITEIEYDPDTGILFATRGTGFSEIYKIDPTTGGILGKIDHEYGALNGLEFVDSTLYATFFSPPETYFLVTVDTDTGNLTPIGSTGLQVPISGLAYDQSTGIMYGITARDDPGILVTIDLNTGATTIVGSTGYTKIGSIEFGPDGNLYGGTTWHGLPHDRSLVKIDKTTGVATLVGYTGLSITGLASCELAIVEVNIDIKPQACPNTLNPISNGVLPVAILGTEEFDVTTIDALTIKLEGISPIRSNLEDVATPHNDDEVCSCNELAGDGYMDLTLKFEIQDLVGALDLEPLMGHTIPLTLTGNLREEEGGLVFTGEDCVLILGK